MSHKVYGKKTNKSLLLAAFLIGTAVTVTISNDSNAQKKSFPMDTAASCITSSCHDGMGKKKYVHAVGVNAKHCRRCHEIAKEGEHSFKDPFAEGRPVCAFCHSSKVVALLHPAAPVHSLTLCSRCHSKEFIASPDIKKSAPEVIFEHVMLKEEEGMNLHAPVAEGKCTGCHDAHESNYYKQLKTEYPSEFYAPYASGTYSLCLNSKCHGNMQKALSEPRTLTDTKFRNGNLNLHFRHVNKEKGRTCQACHHHHGSKNPKLIRKTFALRYRTLTIEYEKTESGGICTPTCHIPIKYDRYSPAEVLITKMTPRLGEDATPEELRLSRQRDMDELKRKQEKDSKPR